MFLRCAAALVLFPLLAHDGPDPIGSWRLSKGQLQDGRFRAVLGQDARVEGKLAFVDDTGGGSLYYDGKTTCLVIAEDFKKSKQTLPTRHLTVDAWVAINTPTRWGGILGVIQDNGDEEAGWMLGYDGERFSFGLASKGADDGNGLMTYLRSKVRYEEGRLYHVCATYDGKTQRLYVNGKLDASSQVQSGDILYPKAASLVLGGYRDSNEFHRFHGRIRGARIFDKTAKPATVRHMFVHHQGLTQARPHLILDPEHRMLVHPYLQWATQRGMTIRWETSRPASSVLHFGTKVQFVGRGEARRPVFPQRKAAKGQHRLHELRLDGLEPNTAYYYRVESTDDQQRVLRSEVSSFQTAPGAETPFAFAVISDTQGNPKVSGAVAAHAWSLRPNFVLHPGDLVSTGSVKQQWIGDFFGSMRPLLQRVALFPVLGNHEQDARFYYDYMSLPAPEYYYTFRYGNAQFFMIDSNRKVGPGSEQYRFLEKELAAAKATWKIVCYHHPAYSSDENDYGNAWYGPSTKGDLRVRKLTPLFEKHQVDIVWNGHIHSYERTWPIAKGRATSSGKGPVYMITGGGGGGLETPGPIRPFFQNTVRRGHHFCFVAVNGKTLEMKAYDLQGRLFDTLKIEKRVGSGR